MIEKHDNDITVKNRIVYIQNRTTDTRTVSQRSES